MPIPTWSPGEVLASADVNNWFVPLAVVKTIDQSLASSTTLQNDTALVLTTAASATYVFSAFIYHTGADAPGSIKYQWVASAATSFTFAAVHNEGGGTGLGNSVNAYNLTSVIFAENSGGAGDVMTGLLVTSASSGTLQFTWAQNSSSATATVVKANSHITLQRIS